MTALFSSSSTDCTHTRKQSAVNKQAESFFAILLGCAVVVPRCLPSRQWTERLIDDNNKPNMMLSVSLSACMHALHDVTVLLGLVCATRNELAGWVSDN
jgi:hypothetical protein